MMRKLLPLLPVALLAASLNPLLAQDAPKPVPSRSAAAGKERIEHLLELLDKPELSDAERAELKAEIKRLSVVADHTARSEAAARDAREVDRQRAASLLERVQNAEGNTDWKRTAELLERFQSPDGAVKLRDQARAGAKAAQRAAEELKARAGAEKSDMDAATADELRVAHKQLYDQMVQELVQRAKVTGDQAAATKAESLLKSAEQARLQARENALRAQLDKAKVDEEAVLHAKEALDNRDQMFAEHHAKMQAERAALEKAVAERDAYKARYENPRQAAVEDLTAPKAVPQRKVRSVEADAGARDAHVHEMLQEVRAEMQEIRALIREIQAHVGAAHGGGGGAFGGGGMAATVPAHGMGAGSGQAAGVGTGAAGMPGHGLGAHGAFSGGGMGNTGGGAAGGMGGTFGGQNSGAGGGFSGQHTAPASAGAFGGGGTTSAGSSSAASDQAKNPGAGVGFAGQNTAAGHSVAHNGLTTAQPASGQATSASAGR